jgi:hypothetical protein
MLDAIDLGDEVERLLSHGCGLQRVEEVATHVREARRPSTARDLLDVVVSAVAVDQEHALRALE